MTHDSIETIVLLGLVKVLSQSSILGSFTNETP